MSAAPSLLRLLAFGVDSWEYVVDVMRIRSIVRPMPVTYVPEAPPFVEGVIDLRGVPIPVVDLRRRFGLATIERGPKARMVIARVEGRDVALLVDRVVEVMRIPPAGITEVPPLLNRAVGGLPAFLGVCEGGSPARLRLLLNVKALLGSEAAVAPPPERQARR